VVTSQSYIPPAGNNNQQARFPVAVQTSSHAPSAPLVDNSTPYNPHITQTSTQLPYPPSPNQNRTGNLPYPSGNNIGFAVASDNRNSDLPPSYDQVKDNKF
jgi:hypothetical protein